MMTTEELLYPRIKIMVDFPQWSSFTHKKGDILVKKGIHFVGKGSARSINEKDVEKYPAIFRKLEWWEERDEKDMPKYVKLVMDNKIQYVHKIELWDGANDYGQSLYEYKNKVNYQMVACVSELEPATKEEYEQQLQTANK